MVAGIVVWARPNWQIVDPLCTLLFSALVLMTTIGTIRSCLKVLMEGAPDGVDVDQINADLIAIRGVSDVHDLHIWSLSVGKPALSVHMGADDTQEALRRAEHVCRSHGIGHSTIQVQPTGTACVTKTCQEGDCTPRASQSHQSHQSYQSQ